MQLLGHPALHHIQSEDIDPCHTSLQQQALHLPRPVLFLLVWLSLYRIHSEQKPLPQPEGG